MRKFLRKLVRKKPKGKAVQEPLHEPPRARPAQASSDIVDIPSTTSIDETSLVISRAPSIIESSHVDETPSPPWPDMKLVKYLENGLLDVEISSSDPRAAMYGLRHPNGCQLHP